jgi:hypothetical protein
MRTTTRPQHASHCVALASAVLLVAPVVAVPAHAAPNPAPMGPDIKKVDKEEALRNFEKALTDYRRVQNELGDAVHKPDVIGAAARIVSDERGARARRAAVRLLGTMDAHRWPEVEQALIASLRADRNEAVRLEAARALAQGNCCTEKTRAALQITADGTDQDGNAAETSARVKKAAREALKVCERELSNKAASAARSH